MKPILKIFLGSLAALFLVALLVPSKREVEAAAKKPPSQSISQKAKSAVSAKAQAVKSKTVSVPLKTKPPAKKIAKQAAPKTPTKSPVAASQPKPETQTAPPQAQLVQSAPPTPVISPPPEAVPNLDEINKKTRLALVNIICTTLRSGSFNPVSGSGVVIDPRGVILTSAHVAQYFLLRDYAVPGFVDCVIRTGEPAQNRYRARILYLAPQWVKENAAKIRLSEPTGNGKNDFALLLITESTNPSVPLPAAYAYVPPRDPETEVKKSEVVLVAGYAAGFLSGINIQKDLYPLSSQGVIGDVYSFDGASRDVFSVAGSPLAQHGSSGGAAVDGSGNLLGIIATASEGATTGERNVNVLTLAHMNKSFLAQNGASVPSFLASPDLPRLAEEFNANTAPRLTKLLTDEINKNAR